jgi:polar amino acid transport system permease protein
MFFLSSNPSMLLEVFNSLNDGFIISLELFILTLVGSLPLGLILCVLRKSKIKIIANFIAFLIWIVRGTPLMLQLLVFYYGPGILFGNNIWGMQDNGRFIAALSTFIFNYACYFSEIYRGGMDSIPIGQYEAGLVLGMTKKDIFFRVTLLQVIKRIIPPIGNEIITLVKDTSLARVIAVYEVIWAGQSFIKAQGIIWPLFATGIYYLVFTGVLTIALASIEKKLDYFKV